MKNEKIFADTSFWVAVLDNRDQWHRAALEASDRIKYYKIITTEAVLIEVLNYFSEFHADVKKYAADYVEEILKDAETLVLLHDHKDFLRALKLYKIRLDKGYSLTDCISMNAMREFGIAEVFTNDTHFSQEGFTQLF